MGHSKSQTFDFIAYGEGLISKRLVKSGVRPHILGLWFLALPLSLTVWGSVDAWRSGYALLDECDCMISYFENISWSVSMFLIFPLFVARTLYFYQEIPKLFNYLLEMTKHPNDKDVHHFNVWLNRWFNLPYLWSLFFILAVALSLLYFNNILGQESNVSWMTSGCLFVNTATGHGLTWMGAYAAIIQGILIYWIINMVWVGTVFVLGLNKFLNHSSFEIKVDAMHCDGCCGLKQLGRVAMIFNMNMLLLGIYLSLKVFDKIYIQGVMLNRDMGNMTVLICFALVAPLFFFLSLGTAHNIMENARNEFLRPLYNKSRELVGAVDKANILNANELLSSLSETETNRVELRKNIPVWPFNVESIQSFLATIILPVLPVITYIIKLVIDIIKKSS